jgi:hypothetical protein
MLQASEQELTFGILLPEYQPPYFYGTMDAAGLSDALLGH